MLSSRPRRRSLPAASLALLALLPFAPAWSETFRQEVLEPDPTLLQGARPTVFVESEEDLWCSGVAVSPRVILTAAHCLKGDEITVKAPGRVKGDCWTPLETWGTAGAEPGSPPALVPDLAVCYLKKDLPKPPETLSTDVNLLRKGAEVVLAGFGCTEWTECKGPKWPSRAQTGKARLLDAVSPQDLYFLTIGDPAQGESALCPGDSGGPVFVLDEDGERRLIGIGQGGCVDCNVQKSAVTSLAAKATVDWLCRWVKEKPKKRAIQGLSCP